MRQPGRERTLAAQQREAVEKRPGGDGELSGIGVRLPPLPLACRDHVMQDLEGFVAGTPELRVADVDQRGTEHDLEVTGMQVGELQVGPSVGMQGFEGAVDTLDGSAEIIGEELKALHRDGREHSGLVAEVVRGGGVGDADPAGHITQR